jgi:hypothetical protein
MKYLGDNYFEDIRGEIYMVVLSEYGNPFFTPVRFKK